MLKAVFVYNFAKYVYWPDSGQETERFELCLAGSDQIVEALQRLQGETLHSRQVTIRHLRTGSSPADCQLLFIGESEQSQLESLLKPLSERPVLTISDISRFAERGGIIEFFWENSKIRFAINLQTAKKAGLKISSRLLKLARIVGEGP